jgi:threonine dehydratase
MAGAKLYFKAENFQRGGAFKIRGAANAVFSLTDQEAAPGVVTHSSGNHAAALSIAAGLRGIPAYIVMPSNAPAVKVAAVRQYGGRITFCEPTLAARESTMEEIRAKTGATLVHPFDDPRIIAGQGTAALELLAEAPDLEMILAPVGGGGLLSGTAVAAEGMKPDVRVVGAEPALADDAYRSLKAGRILPVERTDTIADGLRTSLGQWTFPILKDLVDQVALAGEHDILRAARLLLERAKILVEPSGAVGLAVLLARSVDNPSARIGVILSGGNVDLEKLSFGASSG